MTDRKRACRLIAEALCAGLMFWNFGMGPAAGILGPAGLTACGAERDTQAGAETELETDTETDLETEAGEEPDLRFHPTIRSHFRYASGQQSGEELLAQITYPEIHIPQEETRFSALSSALSRYNSEKEASYLEALKTLAESAKAIHQSGNMDISCSQICETRIARADHTAFSIVENESDYQGGVHGYYGKGGVTYDSWTGQLLAFSDVVRDCDAAAARVVQKLSQEYPALSSPPEKEKLASSMKQRDAGQDQPGLFHWYLTSIGVNLVFPPYTLGSYAEGQQEIQLSFEEDPGLFHPRYSQIPETFVVPFDRDTGIWADATGDGAVDRIAVGGDMDETGAYRNLTVSVNDQALTLSDFPYYSTELYLIRSNASYQIYVFCRSDNDYQILKVFSIGNGAPVELTPPPAAEGRPDPYNLGVRSIEMDDGNETAEIGQSGSYERAYRDETNALTDPGSMLLSTRMDAMSTYQACKAYTAEAGYPVSSDPYYQADADNIRLTLKRVAEFETVSESGEQTGKASYPEGTVFTILRTDGAGTVDLKPAAGEDKIARVSGDFSDWPQQVSGFELETLFDGTVFAG